MSGCAISGLEHFVEESGRGLRVLFGFDAVLVILQIVTLIYFVPLIHYAGILFLAEDGLAPMFKQDASLWDRSDMLKVERLGDDRVIVLGHPPRVVHHALRFATYINFDMLIILGLFNRVRRVYG